MNGEDEIMWGWEWNSRHLLSGACNYFSALKDQHRDAIASSTFVLATEAHGTQFIENSSQQNSTHPHYSDLVQSHVKLKNSTVILIFIMQKLVH